MVKNWLYSTIKGKNISSTCYSLNTETKAIIIPGDQWSSSVHHDGLEAVEAIERRRVRRLQQPPRRLAGGVLLSLRWWRRRRDRRPDDTAAGAGGGDLVHGDCQRRAGGVGVDVHARRLALAEDQRCQEPLQGHDLSAASFAARRDGAMKWRCFDLVWFLGWFSLCEFGMGSKRMCCRSIYSGFAGVVCRTKECGMFDGIAAARATGGGRENRALPLPSNPRAHVSLGLTKCLKKKIHLVCS